MARSKSNGGACKLRKLAWFFIILFCAILGLAIASAMNDDFKVTLTSTLNGVGGGILAGVGTLVQNLADIVSTNVTYFAIYTFGVLAVGGVFWIGVKRLWAKRPAIMQKQVVAQPIYQSVPVSQAPIYIQTPTPMIQVPVAPKVEEKKEAAA